MRFKLIATSIPYCIKDGLTEEHYLKVYLDNIKNADDKLDLPEPFMDDGHVYIYLVNASQFFNLAKTVGQELIIRIDDPEPTIEIYDSWRE